jgi:hypothetical protein
MIPKEVKTIIDFSLGGGSIRKTGENHEASFKLEHSTKQREYLWHKAEILKSLGFIGRERLHTRTLNSKEYYTCSFTTKSHPAISTAYKWIYNKKRKAIDKALLRHLDAISLAYWFMDDGNGSKTYTSVSKINGVRYKYTYPKPKIEKYSLATYNCTLEEILLIQDWLLSSFNVKSEYVVDKRSKTCFGAFIRIVGVEQKDIFRSVIDPYIIPSMRYKIEGAHTFVGMQYSAVETKREDS